MNTIYKYRAGGYILSILGILIGAVMAVVGILQLGTSFIIESVKDVIESNFVGEVTIEEVYLNPADGFFYFEFKAEGSTHIAYLDTDTNMLTEVPFLPGTATPLPGFFLGNQGGLLLGLGGLLSLASFVYLILTIVAHAKFRKQKSTIEVTQSTLENELEEAKRLFEQGLITRAEYEEIRQQKLNRL